MCMCVCIYIYSLSVFNCLLVGALVVEIRTDHDTCKAPIRHDPTQPLYALYAHAPGGTAPRPAASHWCQTALVPVCVPLPHPLSSSLKWIHSSFHGLTGGSESECVCVCVSVSVNMVIYVGICWYMLVYGMYGMA